MPLAMTLVYYFLSVFGLDGPDKMQLIAAETSLILLIVVPFPFPPLGSVLEKTRWSLVLQSLATRALSLLNGCVMALIMRGIGKLWLKCRPS